MQAPFSRLAQISVNREKLIKSLALAVSFNCRVIFEAGNSLNQFYESGLKALNSK
jgi:hypothetical protein